MNISQFDEIVQQQSSWKAPADDIPSQQQSSEDKKPSDTAVVVCGTARNAFSGAVVLENGNRGHPIYLEGMDEWDEVYEGKDVVVRGQIVTKKLAPDPVVDADGAVSHGKFGTDSVLRSYVVELASDSK